MAVTRSTVFAVLCCMGLTAGSLALPTSRILDGEDAINGQFPWAVSVRVDNVHSCGGSIISDRHIITSASDVSRLGTTPIDASRVSVRVGSFNQYAGGEIISIEKIDIHPSYGSFIHNIAILTLSKSLTFSDKIAKIAYAGIDDVVAEGSSVVVSGWGLKHDQSLPYKLQHTTMTVLNASDCESQAGYGYDSVLCLSHRLNDGLAAGDAGGPVVQDNKLVGVASFAFGTGGTKYPDISSRVAFYADWIAAVIA